MKYVFTFYCMSLFFVASAMQDCQADRVVQIQESTWPLRNDLRKLKNIIAAHKCSLPKEQLLYFKQCEDDFKKRAGSVSQHLDNVIKQLDHIRMDASQQLYVHMNKHFNKAEEHLENAKAELGDYKIIVKTMTKIDVDSNPKL